MNIEGSNKLETRLQPIEKLSDSSLLKPIAKIAGLLVPVKNRLFDFDKELDQKLKSDFESLKSELKNEKQLSTVIERRIKAGIDAESLKIFIADKDKSTKAVAKLRKKLEHVLKTEFIDLIIFVHDVLDGALLEKNNIDKLEVIEAIHGNLLFYIEKFELEEIVLSDVKTKVNEIIEEKTRKARQSYFEISEESPVPLVRVSSGLANNDAPSSGRGRIDILHFEDKLPEPAVLPVIPPRSVVGEDAPVSEGRRTLRPGAGMFKSGSEVAYQDQFKKLEEAAAARRKSEQPKDLSDEIRAALSHVVDEVEAVPQAEERSTLTSESVEQTAIAPEPIQTHVEASAPAVAECKAETVVDGTSVVEKKPKVIVVRPGERPSSEVSYARRLISMRRKGLDRPTQINPDPEPDDSGEDEKSPTTIPATPAGKTSKNLLAETLEKARISYTDGIGIVEQVVTPQAQQEAEAGLENEFFERGENYRHDEELPETKREGAGNKEQILNLNTQEKKSWFAKKFEGAKNWLANNVIGKKIVKHQNKISFAVGLSAALAGGFFSYKISSGLESKKQTLNTAASSIKSAAPANSAPVKTVEALPTASAQKVFEIDDLPLAQNDNTAKTPELLEPKVGSKPDFDLDKIDADKSDKNQQEQKTLVTPERKLRTDFYGKLFKLSESSVLESMLEKGEFTLGQMSILDSMMMPFRGLANDRQKAEIQKLQLEINVGLVIYFYEKFGTPSALAESLKDPKLRNLYKTVRLMKISNLKSKVSPEYYGKARALAISIIEWDGEELGHNVSSIGSLRAQTEGNMFIAHQPGAKIRVQKADGSLHVVLKRMDEIFDGAISANLKKTAEDTSTLDSNAKDDDSKINKTENSGNDQILQNSHASRNIGDFVESFRQKRESRFVQPAPIKLNFELKKTVDEFEVYKAALNEAKLRFEYDGSVKFELNKNVSYFEKNKAIIEGIIEKLIVFYGEENRQTISKIIKQFGFVALKELIVDGSDVSVKIAPRVKQILTQSIIFQKTGA